VKLKKMHMSEKTIPTNSLNELETQQRTDFRFVFSLIGGVLITLGSAIGISYAMMKVPYFWGMGSMMVGNYGYLMPNMMGGGNIFGNGLYTPDFYGKMISFETLGLVAGLFVLIFAILMRSKPRDRKTFGVIILAFSILSLIGTGGFLVGAILGVVGGVVALTNT